MTTKNGIYVKELNIFVPTIHTIDSKWHNYNIVEYGIKHQLQYPQQIQVITKYKYLFDMLILVEFLTITV